MLERKFFQCRHCGNLVGMIKDAGVQIICCGEPMARLIPNTVEASKEKHLPVVTVSGDSVNIKIGSEPHPMVNEHYIVWVYLLTENGGERYGFKPGDTPEITLKTSSKPISVYAYCNIHGLWETRI